MHEVLGDLDGGGPVSSMTINMAPTASFLDVQRLMDDLEGFGWDIVVNVDISGTVMVDGIPKDERFRIADFVMNRNRWVIDRITDDLGMSIA